ncbi:MAG TPA: phasin family protein [Alphaproteobacteria bacterium]|nr:phasin family protein [Alphaproteobacteria bacterium]
MARRQTKSRAAASRAAETADEAGNQAVETADAVRHAIDKTGEQVRAGMHESMKAGSRQFAVLGEQAFEAWMRTSNETLQRALALNVELASWGREQLDDSLGAVRSLAQCRSFGDAYGVQLGLMRSSMENSLRHANRVLSLTANLISAGTRAGQQAQAQD